MDSYEDLEMTTAYQITKEVCQANIDKNGNVCDYCGRDIVPIETVDNADNPTYWAGCMHGTKTAGNFTGGVKREIYELAEKLVCDGEQPYAHKHKSEYCKTPEERLHWFQSQVSGACSQIRRMEHLKTNPARKTKDEFLADEYW